MGAGTPQAGLLHAFASEGQSAI